MRDKCMATVCISATCTLQAAEEDLDFDPEDGDECDDLRDFLTKTAIAKNSAAGGSKDQQSLRWDLVSFLCQHGGCCQAADSLHCAAAC